MGEPTVHFIYPHGPAIACPHAIGTQLGARLRRHWRVLHYDLTEPRPIRPEQGDILLGHPDANRWTVFRASLADPRWGRRLMMAPFAHGDLRSCAYLDPLMPRCDRFLAITGSYWVDTLASSPCAHWAPKLVHLDLAVDAEAFPPIKRAFAPPGSRRFVYIGHAGWYKNLPYLDALARRLAPTAFHWIGDADPALGALKAEGRHDFATERGRAAVAAFDFLITVGQADPNPTTILEAMAWGLIPVCSRESGYHQERGVVNVPLGDVEGAAAALARLQHLPEAELLAMQAHNRERLRAHFHWDRFASVVEAQIRAQDAPALLRRSVGNRLRMRWAELRAPQSGLRLQQLRRALLQRLGRRQRPHPCGVGGHCATQQPPA